MKQIQITKGKTKFRTVPRFARWENSAQAEKEASVVTQERVYCGKYTRQKELGHNLEYTDINQHLNFMLNHNILERIKLITTHKMA